MSCRDVMLFVASAERAVQDGGANLPRQPADVGGGECHGFEEDEVMSVTQYAEGGPYRKYVYACAVTREMLA